MVHLVLTGAVAGGAFILSLIIGFLSGVSVGTVFLRALGGGLLFAALANVVRFMIGRFLPELMEPMDSSEEKPPSEEGSVEGPGERINIVLDDEDETSAADAAEAAISGEARFQEEGFDDLLAEEPPGKGVGEPALGGDEMPVSAPAEGLGEPEEQEGVPSESVDSASLEEEEIPEIASFDGEFDNPSGVDLVEDKFSEPTASAAILGRTHDTEEMARAVQRVLQKDQEG